MSKSEKNTTHFGYQEVPVDEKQDKVKGVFDSVAKNYDIMNDLMSLGVHRLWKKFTLEQTGLREGMQALDVAGGTGDIAIGLAKQVGPSGHVILTDINENMLEVGRDRLIDAGIGGNVSFQTANAEDLPFDDNSFDCVSIAFGLRNVTDKDKALRSMHRVLKPGGRLLVLEFSKPVAPGLGPVYDTYSFKILPLLGKLVARDSESYQYLAESIRMHPDQETLKQMLTDAGFARVRYQNLTGGIVALHRGYKI
ncbi:MAG: bifunctional demethylmenaquinone methyltransferase/2-methoxy-6-polyprenyl-1,4-benzoquinol methylase UbiE [Gammaproteobacteria bacterium]|nr:bifunctional demethylmenaquinone methyltransferase/2-methoxy-6-polyprenyl-1,4-benzoquinol methylase UbiE [Gammaproteobacteria bacterium]NNC98252.1 bifunctional demethylmenaquinone methyltransferase/2-methoxy-6-polyprenyl-1,4-benzoquinol methylase UbiE [Gammaproteobacteria bacterium]